MPTSYSRSQSQPTEFAYKTNGAHFARRLRCEPPLSPRYIYSASGEKQTCFCRIRASVLAKNLFAAPAQSSTLLPFGFKVHIGYAYNRVPCFVRASKTVCGTSKGGKGAGSRHDIVYKPYQAPPEKPHDQKNMDLNRPMSPHLTIYAPTLPAMTSIVQRITGVIVLSYALLMATGALFLPNGVESYVSVIQSLDLSAVSIFVVKILLGAPFAFHYANGIRYCAWNTGRWLAMKDVYSTAHKALIASGVLTLLFSLF